MNNLQRHFRPNAKGIITEAPPVVKTGGNVTIYTRSIDNLQRIDRLIKGGKPRICVLRKQGGIGDVLMTLPTVKHISKKYDIKIDYGTDFAYLEGALRKVLLYNPYIENILEWKKVIPEQYDTILDLTCPCLDHEKPLAPPINRIDLFARHLNIRLEDPSIDYTVTEEEEKWARGFISQQFRNNNNLILVQPFSSTLNRDAPIKKLQNALSIFSSLKPEYGFIIITNLSDNIRTSWNLRNTLVLDNFDCRKITAIMKCCKMLICPDSAVLHLASALRFPTLTIFGSTDPRARINYHKEAIALWPAKHLKNFPKWYDVSPQDLSLCWGRLNENEIIEGIISVLEKKPLLETSNFISYR